MAPPNQTWPTTAYCRENFHSANRNVMQWEQPQVIQVDSRAELAGMTLGAMKKIALAEGIARDAIDAADFKIKPREEIIKLIVSNRKVDPMAEFDGMTLGSVKTIALDEGSERDTICAADFESKPWEEVVKLILAKRKAGRRYNVVYGGGLPVTETHFRNSGRVGQVFQNDTVEVLGFWKEPVDGRIRAHIASPLGWVTTSMADGSFDFVVKAQAPAEYNPAPALEVDGPIQDLGRELAEVIEQTDFEKAQNIQASITRLKNARQQVRQLERELGKVTERKDFENLMCMQARFTQLNGAHQEALQLDRELADAIKRTDLAKAEDIYARLTTLSAEVADSETDQQVQQLERELSEAIERTDFDRAKNIHARITQLRQWERELAEVVERKDFEQAFEIHNKIIKSMTATTDPRNNVRARHLNAFLQMLEQELICPISYELPEDPVLATDGHTYERRDMERWLRERRSSPMTGAPLGSMDLTSNHVAKKLIGMLTEWQTVHGPRPDQDALDSCIR